MRITSNELFFSIIFIGTRNSLVARSNFLFLFYEMVLDQSILGCLISFKKKNFLFYYKNFVY